MAVCNKYEAQCETSRMLCMLAKRPEIHTYINLFGIVTILVEELLNSRYTITFIITSATHTNSLIKMTTQSEQFHNSIFYNKITVITNNAIRYCQWTRQHAMLALAGLSESECCQVASTKLCNTKETLHGRWKYLLFESLQCYHNQSSATFIFAQFGLNLHRYKQNITLRIQ